MSDTAAWTIGRLLTWTQKFLGERGADSPRLDAEILLAHARGCRRIELYTAFDETPNETVRATFRDLVRRRGEGLPVAYLVGRREFYSLDFLVSPEVLIPRPETEFVVVAAIDWIKRQANPAARAEIWDVGTGSGAIAVAVAKHAPRARVLATDISPAALAVARQNVDRHAVADRVALLESDLASAVPPAQEFDLVLSNPPYVSSAEFDQLPIDVRQHEPRGALEAGPTGLEVIERLVPLAAQRLKPGGQLIVEISPPLEHQARSVVESAADLQLLPTVKDLAGLARVLVAKKRPAGVG